MAQSPSTVVLVGVGLLYAAYWLPGIIAGIGFAILLTAVVNVVRGGLRDG